MLRRWRTASFGGYQDSKAPITKGKMCITFPACVKWSFRHSYLVTLATAALSRAVGPLSKGQVRSIMRTWLFFSTIRSQRRHELASLTARSVVTSPKRIAWERRSTILLFRGRMETISGRQLHRTWGSVSVSVQWRQVGDAPVQRAFTAFVGRRFNRAL